MLNGREPAGIAGEAIARLNVYQQLDNERNSLIQVSMPAAIAIVATITTTTAIQRLAYTT
jgi:hypothetical protein